jgi:prolipoprotein diacylglyceryl transferase
MSALAIATPAFIPSPSNGTVHLGPIPLHMYGLLLAVGVVVATLIAERRWQHWGHDRKEIGDIAVVVVICGVVGARLYHVASDYELFTGSHWVRAFEIWRGGLSIWGVILGGAIGVLVMTWRRHLDTLGIMDAIAAGLLAAQGIGRWGNYFNQELFGEPTRLPWGLEIDLAHRPKGFEQFSTFHPTFLYESLYCLALLALLFWVERRFTLRRGQSFAFYVSTYTFGRFWLENLRIDFAHTILGLRLNAWVSLLACVGATTWFIWLARHGRVDPKRYPEAAASGADGPPARVSGATPES